METLEQLWLLDQVQALKQMKAHLQRELVKKDKDLGLMTQIRGVEHDLSILEPVLSDQHKSMVAKYEKLSGKQFKIIKTK